MGLDARGEHGLAAVLGASIGAPVGCLALMVLCAIWWRAHVARQATASNKASSAPPSPAGSSASSAGGGNAQRVAPVLAASAMHGEDDASTQAAVAERGSGGGSERVAPIATPRQSMHRAGAAARPPQVGVEREALASCMTAAATTAPTALGTGMSRGSARASSSPSSARLASPSSSEQRDGRGVVVAEPIGAGTPSSCKALPLAASTRRAASNDDAAIDALEAGSSFLVLDEIGRMQTHEHDDPAAAAPATTAAALQSVARDYAPARVAGATAWHDRLVRGGSSTELPRAGTGVAPLASDEVGVAAVVLHEPQPPSDILVLNSAYRVLHQMQPPFMCAAPRHHAVRACVARHGRVCAHDLTFRAVLPLRAHRSVKPSSSDVSNLRPHAGGDTWP